MFANTSDLRNSIPSCLLLKNISNQFKALSHFYYTESSYNAICPFFEFLAGPLELVVFIPKAILVARWSKVGVEIRIWCSNDHNARTKEGKYIGF